MQDSQTIETPAWEEPTGPGRSVVSGKTLVIIIVVCAILSIAQDLFLPLAMGMLFAFILTPVVNFLRRRGLRDMPAVILTVLAAASLVAAFFLIIAYQLSQIGTNLPQYQGNVLSKIDTILEAGQGSGIITHMQGMVENISNRIEAQNAASSDETMKVELVEQVGVMDWLTGVIIPALSPIAIFGLIFVVVVFALMERAALRDRLVQLIGGTNILATSRLLAEAGSRVSTYLVAQLLVNVIYALPIWLGLWLIGVPNALFFGLVTLIFRFVPYIGSAISAILPLLMAFAVSPDWSLVLWTAGLFLFIELITSNIIEPWFYGQRTGLSPLAVIVSAMFWTWLWGPMGLIIATPLTVCLVVIGHHVPNLRLFPIMLGDQPVLAESARLYDRLLAGHTFSFLESATTATNQRYLAEFYDDTAIPALSLAQADHQAGLLSDYQAERIAHAAWNLTDELETVVEDELVATDAPAEDAPEDQSPLGAVLDNGRLTGAGHSIVVLGAKTRLDDAAAQMLAQAMRARGAAAVALPHRSPLPQALGSFQPQTLILMTLDSTPAQTVTLLVRQLRRRLPGVRIGIAHWPSTTVREEAAPFPTSRRGTADFIASGMQDVLSNAFASSEAKAA